MPSSSATTQGATFRVRLLGPLAVERAGIPIDTSRWQHRVTSLFALLTTASDQRRLREEVIECLWPEAEPGAGPLRLTAHRLRLALGGGNPPAVISEQGWIRLNPAHVWEIDLHAFEQYAQCATRDVEELEQALALYRGEPLPDQRYEDWAMPIREHAQRTWRDLSLKLAECSVARGQYSRALSVLYRLLEHDPLDEDVVRMLVDILACSGTRVSALRVYQEFEQRLLDELGVLPSPETMAVVQRLRAQEAYPATLRRSEISTPSLAIGVSLGTLPEGAIVGRDEELDRILLAADLVEAGSGQLVVVHGERGVGKTRIAQEVAVRLQDRGFVVATGRCFQHRQEAPLTPLIEVLDHIHRIIAPGWWEQIAGDQKAGMADGAPSALLAAGAIDSYRLSWLVGSTIAAVAHERPLAILLDDLQWVDADTLNLIADLARRTARSRVFLFGTYRDDEVDREHRLHRTICELAREGLGQRVLLRRLTHEGTVALIEAHLGAMEGAAEFSDFVFRRSRGNPFYIDQMLQAVAGRYTLIRQLGVGGMGRVFEAIDMSTGDLVAVKLMFARTEADPKAVRRFEQEGAILAQLDHPNIVKVHATVLNEWTNAIVMELVGGASLGRLMHTELPSQALDRIKGLARQIVEALVSAHDHGVVHRDIKPDNIMVLPDDHVKVTDFGIAHLVRPRGAMTTMVSTGLTMGTPYYMAPEQITGESVDGRADLYSLGILLYRLVTGQLPFDGDDPLTIAFQHVYRPPVPPRHINPNIPRDWEAVILKAMAKDPAERFPTAAAMGQAIDLLGGPRAQELVPDADTSGLRKLSVADAWPRDSMTADEEALHDVVSEVLYTVTEDERTILRLRFGLLGGQSLAREEVQRVTGLTLDQILKLEAKALQLLRNPTHAQQLRRFLHG